MAFDPSGLVYVRKQHVTVKYKKSGQGATFKSIGCPAGDFVVNDSMSEGGADTALDNWCANIAAQGADLVQFDGELRTVELSGTVEVDLSDDFYHDAYTDYDNGDAGEMEVVFKNAGSGTHTLTGKGHFTGWPLTPRDGDGGAGTARLGLTFHVNSTTVDAVVTG